MNDGNEMCLCGHEAKHHHLDECIPKDSCACKQFKEVPEDE